MKRFGAFIGFAACAAILTGLKGQPMMQENTPHTTEHVGHMADETGNPGVTRRVFGEVDGKKANLYTLRNANGMTVGITDYGATVTSVVVPDRNGNPVDVALGFDTVEEYGASEVPVLCFGEHYFMGAVLVEKFENDILMYTHVIQCFTSVIYS